MVNAFVVMRPIVPWQQPSDTGCDGGRMHPFANGNGPIARTWAAFVVLRHGLPVFVAVKPRPGDLAYTRAGRDSMGRPPDFVGDHSTSVAVFGHLLTLAVLR